MYRWDAITRCFRRSVKGSFKVHLQRRSSLRLLKMMPKLLQDSPDAFFRFPGTPGAVSGLIYVFQIASCKLEHVEAL